MSGKERQPGRKEQALERYREKYAEYGPAGRGMSGARRPPDGAGLHVASLAVGGGVVATTKAAQIASPSPASPRATAEHVQPSDKVVVSEQLDGKRRIFTVDRELPWSTVREAPPP